MYDSSKIERKRLCTEVYGDVEEALFTWSRQVRSMNIPVSGPILAIKAKELAIEMGPSRLHLQY